MIEIVENLQKKTYFDIKETNFSLLGYRLIAVLT